MKKCEKVEGQNSTLPQLVFEKIGGRRKYRRAGTQLEVWRAGQWQPMKGYATQKNGQWYVVRMGEAHDWWHKVRVIGVASL